MLKRSFLLSLLFLANSTVYAQSVQGDKETYMSDPIEPVNRLVWDFNYYVLDFVMTKDFIMYIFHFIINICNAFSTI